MARSSASSRNRRPGPALPRPGAGAIAAAAVAAALATISAAHSYAQVTNRTAIRGLGPVANSSSAALSAVSERLAEQRGIGPTDRALSAARATLRVAPLNGQAVRTAGLAFAQDGRPAAAAAAMRTAVRISRRESVAQSWLINEAVRRGEIGDVLTHYDAVLRTVPAASRPLLQNLARTLAVPQMRAAMRPYVENQAPWFEAMAAVAIETPGTAVAFARMLDGTRAIPDSPGLRSIYAVMIRSLADQQQLGLVDRLFPRLPEASARDFVSLDFTPPTATAYAPVSWSLTSDGSVGGSVVGSGANTAMELYAASGAGGVAATKLVKLAPGRHAIRWRLIEAPTAADAAIRLQLRCATDPDAAPIADVAMPAPRPSESADGDGRTSQVAFAVERSCPMLSVTLRVAGGTDRDEARWLIDRLQVSPARPPSAATPTR